MEVDVNEQGQLLSPEQAVPLAVPVASAPMAAEAVPVNSASTMAVPPPMRSAPQPLSAQVLSDFYRQCGENKSASQITDILQSPTYANNPDLLRQHLKQKYGHEPAQAVPVNSAPMAMAVPAPMPAQAVPVNSAPMAMAVPAPMPAQAVPVQAQAAPAQWTCGACTMANASNLLNCHMCNTPRPQQAQSVFGFAK
jgi:hypothetical protein